MPNQQTLNMTIDGNVEHQDTQPPTIGTNKIKINITKNVQLNKSNTINASENIDNNLAINDNDKKLAGGSANANIANATKSKSEGQCENDAEAVTEIEYELKESMKHVNFKRQPVVRSGLETSGLCSIM